MSHDNDVTMVLGLNRSNFSPVRHFLLKCASYLLAIYLSTLRGFTRINKRNFEISWNLYKKGINYAYIEDWTNAGKFATFWMFPKSIYHSFDFGG